MHQTVSAPYYTENASLHLGINGLLAGIFDEFDIDETVNNICPKTAANVKVSSSELLRVFVMCLATNPFRGLRLTAYLTVLLRQLESIASTTILKVTTRD